MRPLILLILLTLPPSAVADPIRVEFGGHFTEAFDHFDLLPDGLEVGNQFRGWFEYSEPANVHNLPGGGIGFLLPLHVDVLDLDPFTEASIFNDRPTLDGPVDGWAATDDQFVEEIGTGIQVRRTIALQFADFDADQIPSLVPQFPTSLEGWERVVFRITFDRILLDPGYGITGAIDRYEVVPEPHAVLLMALALGSCAWHRRTRR